jgi:hypothetical protein
MPQILEDEAGTTQVTSVIVFSSIVHSGTPKKIFVTTQVTSVIVFWKP